MEGKKVYLVILCGVNNNFFTLGHGMMNRIEKVR